MKRSELSEQEQQVRDTAQRESWSLNDPRANYPLAEKATKAQAEGRERADA
jgi:hypothetical protein